MHIFHKYRNWRIILVDVIGFSGYKLYTRTEQRGTCVTCGRFKDKRMD